MFDSPYMAESNIAFPLKLFTLLEKDSCSAIYWKDHGLAFCVQDVNYFTQNIMPRYFKQTKMTSFQRQLNLYGFRRLTKGDDYGAYFHPKFQRGRSDLLNDINRLPGKGKAPPVDYTGFENLISLRMPSETKTPQVSYNLRNVEPGSKYSNQESTDESGEDESLPGTRRTRFSPRTKFNIDSSEYGYKHSENEAIRKKRGVNDAYSTPSPNEIKIPPCLSRPNQVDIDEYTMYPQTKKLSITLEFDKTKSKLSISPDKDSMMSFNGKLSLPPINTSLPEARQDLSLQSPLLLNTELNPMYRIDSFGFYTPCTRKLFARNVGTTTDEDMVDLFDLAN